MIEIIFSIGFLIILFLVFFLVGAEDSYEPNRLKRYWISFLGLLLMVFFICLIIGISNWADKPTTPQQEYYQPLEMY